LIWGSSFVFVKMALEHVGPLTIAGLRYFGGFVLLLPMLAVQREVFRRRPTRHWWQFLLMGILSFTIGNGALFWALQRLPATTGSFLGNLIPIPVLFLGIIFLRELPTAWQIIGLFVALGGNWLFFSPGLERGQPLALLAIGVAVLAFSAFSILTRQLTRSRQVSLLAVTAFPLALGGGLQLILGLSLEGWPQMPPLTWGYILLLIAVHTALGYLLFNHAFEELTALEMNMLLNLIPFSTAIWAWLLLGERLVWPQQLGMVLTVGGMTLVQLFRRADPSKTTADS
jgi:drug/metabolite transporter (DMT)-like permease